jgi:myo-inositol 2-dehydrogenase/D-chiro-inositol 1-dehydrogenase
MGGSACHRAAIVATVLIRFSAMTALGASRGRGAADRRIGVGMVGCGRVAWSRHLPALGNLRRAARIVALADGDADALARAGEELGVDALYPGAGALVENPAVDVVAVLVPAEAHAEVVVTALEAGKNVIVEKPLALTLDDCDRIVEAASRHPSLVAMIAFNLRHHGLIRRAKEEITAGKVGAIEAINTLTIANHIDFGSTSGSPAWKLDRARGGGALIEQGVHHYDLWRFLSGDDASEISTLTRVEGGRDRISTVAARMEGGGIATCLLGYSTTPSNDVSVHGRKGRIDVSINQFDGFRFRPSSRYPGSPLTRLRHAAGSLAALPAGLRSLPAGGYLQSYTEEWRHFLACVRGEAELESGFSDGREATRMARAAVESAETGRAVRLDRSVARRPARVET